MGVSHPGTGSIRGGGLPKKEQNWKTKAGECLRKH